MLTLGLDQCSLFPKSIAVTQLTQSTLGKGVIYTHII